MYFVVCAGEEVAQVVWEHFGQCHARLLCDLLHICPEVAAVYGVSVFCDEDGAFCDIVFLTVAEQLEFELFHKVDGPVFSFVADGDLSACCRSHGEELHLADAYPGRAHGLKDEGEAVFFLLLCGADEGFVFLLGQFSFLVADEVSLHFQCRHMAVVPAHVAEEDVQGDEHAVGARCLVVGFEMFFVADHAVFGDVSVFLRFQPGGEGADVADVFIDRVL